MIEAVGACAFVSVAANIKPEEHIPMALAQLEAFVCIEALSTFFRTAPIDRPEQPDYLNGVARIRTDMAPLDLKTAVLRVIETALGRERTDDAYAARCIDLDLILYQDYVVHNDDLTLPDPDILTRPFLSAGILELAPDITLPGDTEALATHVSQREMAELNKDTAFTRILKERFTP
tara:strand:+ start:971 stop:1501 length:531 start_codon:yes stop_codon:yes gene_type:complete